MNEVEKQNETEVIACTKRGSLKSFKNGIGTTALGKPEEQMPGCLQECFEKNGRV
jgi:hypothetical protein